MDLYRKLIKNEPEKLKSYNETFQTFYKNPHKERSFTNLTTEAETLCEETTKETIRCVSLINS